MGPLFSAFWLAAILGAISIFTFLIVRYYQTTAKATRYTILFVVGLFQGAGLAVCVLGLFFGFDRHLTSTSQVIIYLSLIAITGLVGGYLSVWGYMKISKV